MFMLKCFIYIGYGTVLLGVWFCQSKQSEFLTSGNEGYICLVFAVNYARIWFPDKTRPCDYNIYYLFQ